VRRKLRAGTRGSLLAQRQTLWVVEKIKEKLPGVEIQVVTISTRGDLEAGVSIPQIGEKGLFTKELEKALLDGEIDFAVHSLKDLPTELLPGLSLGAVPVRANPFDALVTRNGVSFDDLPSGTRIGTSSLRRAAQIRYARPDLIVTQLRGNVDTRIRKLEQGLVDALILAAAGLERMGWSNQNYCQLPPEVFLPAPGQGALAVEVRTDDPLMRDVCAVLDDLPVRYAVTAERAFLRALGGGCQLPVGALAVVEDGRLWLRGSVIRKDGSAVVKGEISGDPAQASLLGKMLANDLLEKGAKEILASES